MGKKCYFKLYQNTGRNNSVFPKLSVVTCLDGPYANKCPCFWEWFCQNENRKHLTTGQISPTLDICPGELSRAKLPLKLLLNFEKNTIEFILTNSTTVWYAWCTTAEQRSLRREGAPLHHQDGAPKSGHYLRTHTKKESLHYFRILRIPGSLLVPTLFIS